MKINFQAVSQLVLLQVFFKNLIVNAGIINELMGQPIEKNLPPKLEYYIQKKQLVTMEELLTIYEWPEKLLNKELKKLTLQQKVEKLQYPEGEFWKSKMPQC